METSVRLGPVRADTAFGVSQGSKQAAGIDLSASEAATVPPRGCSAISTNVRIVGLPPGFHLEVRPRSGLAARGIIAVSGVIDADYEGEIKVILHNTTEEPFEVQQGNRVAQLLPVFYPPVPVEVDATLIASTRRRGEQGFGSTGW